MSDFKPFPECSPGMQIVCRYCGSHAVLRDAWASWDFEKQQWVLADLLDHAHCCDCDNETSLEEVPEGQPFVPVGREEPSFESARKSIESRWVWT